MSIRSRGQFVTALVALAAGVGSVAGSFAVVGLRREFVVVPVERVLTDTVPGPVIIFVIEQFGSAGQQFNFVVATLLTVAVFALLSAVGIAVGRRFGTPVLAVATTVGLSWTLATVLTDAPFAAAGVGLGCGLVVGLAEVLGRDVQTIQMSTERRQLLTASLSALGLGALGLGANGLGDDTQSEREQIDAVTNANSNVEGSAAADRQSDTGTDDGDQAGTDEQSEDDKGQSEAPPSYRTERSVSELKTLAAERSLDIPSIEPLISEDHYTVDINSVDPTVDRESWTLSVTGDVENELELSFEDLRERAAENRFVTLRCVGDPINGKKIDTAVWTGVPASELLEEAVPKSDTCCVMLRAADDFYEEFPLSALDDGLLAYGMNGETLPKAHGYPLRALVPGHWGEVNVKWLTEIEVLSYAQTGYWEKRGWNGTGPVNTVAKLWNDANHSGVVHHDDGTIELAGHAYAGTRGIERVEISTDGGETWADAELPTPLPGEDVWRQWTYTYDSPGEEHEVVVRAVDGTGERQYRGEQGVYPSGATGWVRQTIDP